MGVAMSDFIARLRELGACDEAVLWAESLGPDAPLKHAWSICERGDWLLWWAEKNDVDCSELGYWCAERARQSAIRALGDLGAGLIACEPISDRRTAMAAWAAADAAWAAAWWAARAAADAAAEAAGAAEEGATTWAAAWAAADAAEAAEAAAAAEAGAARWAAARVEELRAIADEVRRRIVLPMGALDDPDGT